VSDINVIVVSAEEAEHGVAEFWAGGEMIGVTCLNEGRLQLQIAARADGGSWTLDTTSLATGLSEAARLISAY